MTTIKVNRIPWNKGKKYKLHSYNSDKNHPNYKEIISKKCKCCNEDFNGKPCYIKNRNFCSVSCSLKYRHKYFSESFEHQREIVREIGKRNKGKKLTLEQRKKIGRPMELNANWQGGISFEPYGIEFNEELKEKIRKKHGRRCVECKYAEKQLNKKLSIHHIDYNKKNNSENNLIPLCNSCHLQTNYNREDWSNYFLNNIEIIK